MKHLAREHQRAYITFYLRVFEGDEFLGFIIDIATGGMKFISDFELQTGKNYNLKIKLPSSLEWKDKKMQTEYIRFSAKCLWSKIDTQNSDFYISGVEFTDLGEDENKIIHAMIQQYKIP